MNAGQVSDIDGVEPWLHKMFEISGWMEIVGTEKEETILLLILYVILLGLGCIVWPLKKTRAVKDEGHLENVSGAHLRGKNKSSQVLTITCLQSEAKNSSTN